jgi:uncharacterized protein (DUF697 family)
MLRRYGFRRGPAVAGGPASGTGVGYGARAGLSALGTIVAVIGSIVAAIIVLGIALVLLKANPGNALVKDIHDVAKALVGPFDGMFTMSNHHRTEIAVNWGIAAVVWFALSRLIAGMLHRA